MWTLLRGIRKGVYLIHKYILTFFNEVEKEEKEKEREVRAKPVLVIYRKDSATELSTRI